MSSKNLVSALFAGVVITAAGTSLVKSFVDGYFDSKPHLTYLVNGREVLTRTFETNEELASYEKSEQGRKEIEYYSSLNYKRDKK